MEFGVQFNNFMFELDKEIVPLDWSFANDLLSDITEIESAEGVLVPFPDSIEQVDCLGEEIYPTTTTLPIDHLSIPNYYLPWYYTDEITPTEAFHTTIFPSNDYSILDPNNQILEALPLSPVLIVPDAMDTGKLVKSEAIISQDICLNETNINFEEKVPNHTDESAITVRTEMGRARLAHISYNDLKPYFYMPITQAAKEMKVGLTILKKRCRELGIPRWPHRKLKSLRSLIRNEFRKNTTDWNVTRELEILARHMEENPEIQLTEKTKKLRQACFKASYKKRRGQLTYHQLRF